MCRDQRGTYTSQYFNSNTYTERGSSTWSLMFDSHYREDTAHTEIINSRNRALLRTGKTIVSQRQIKLPPCAAIR